MTQRKIKIEYMPIEELKRWPENPKNHNIDAIQRSMRAFGYVSPIIVDESTNTIIAGHGRLEALSRLKKLGATPPDGIKVNGDRWLVPVVCGVKFDDAQNAAAYAIADNRLVELGGWNTVGLAEVVRKLEEDINIEAIGFEPGEFDALEIYATDIEDVNRTKYGEIWGKDNNMVRVVLGDLDMSVSRESFETLMQVLEDEQKAQKRAYNKLLEVIFTNAHVCFKKD